jgi:hypothetical protein
LPELQIYVKKGEREMRQNKRERKGERERQRERCSTLPQTDILLLFLAVLHEDLACTSLLLESHRLY